MNVRAISLTTAIALLGLLPMPAFGGPSPDALTLGELTVPAGIDRAAARNTVEGELRRIEPARLPKRKHVVSVTMADIPGATGASCAVSAVVWDAQKGNMLAVVGGQARADGGASSPQIHQVVMRSAVRGAVDQIPEALR